MGVLDGRSSRCVIELHVLGDIERFDSPDEFVEGVSGQALRNFDSAAICVRDESSSVTVTFSRRELRGVTLEVEGRKGARPTPTAIKDAVAPSITRGGFRRAQGPREAQTGADVLRAHRDLNHRRAGRLALAHSVAFGGLCFLTLLLLLGESFTRSLSWGLGGFAVLCVGLVFVGRKWPHLTDPVFPALDLADVTPGRRNARLLRLVPVVPAATWIVDKLW
jgi:hypothetical protein